MTAIVQSKTLMMTDGSGFSQGRSAAGWCHDGSALDQQLGSDASQVIARKPREKAWAEEWELWRWSMDAVPDAIYVKDGG